MKYYVQLDSQIADHTYVTSTVFDFNSRNPALKKVRELLAQGYTYMDIITNASSLPRNQKIMCNL